MFYTASISSQRRSGTVNQTVLYMQRDGNKENKLKKVKTAHCKRCGLEHERPVGRACTRLEDSDVEGSETQEGNDTSISDSPVAADPLHTVLQKLSDIERRIHKIESNSMSHSSTPTPITSSPIKSIPEPEVIPPMNFLKTNQAIQAEVASRIRSLEQHNSYQQGKNNVKSGRYRAADCNVNRYISWPHEFVYAGPNRKIIPYDELNIQQFNLGFIRIAMQQQPHIKDLMFQYLAKVIQSSLDTSFEHVRAAHAVVLQEMERGVIDWTNVDEIEKLRILYTNKHSNNSDGNSSESKRTICNNYNMSRCKASSDHSRDNITFRHICGYCYRSVRKAYNHPESSCNRKQKTEGSK